MLFFSLLFSCSCKGGQKRIQKLAEGIRHIQNKMAQDPFRRKMKDSVVKYDPMCVKTGQRFTLVLTVTEKWPDYFVFRIDNDKYFGGYLDDEKRPCAELHGLSRGERLLYVSFDNETWNYLGQVKVEGNSIWIFAISIVLLMLAIFTRKTWMRRIRGYLRHRRSGNGARLPSANN